MSEPRPLDLAAIARDPNLVRPGNPDGSPVYSEMMRRLALPGTQPATSPAPDIEALSILRAWIESLPPSAATCPHPSDPTRRHIEPLLVKHAARVGRPISALRVLTVAHLDAGCLTAEQLTGWREALGRFMAALAGSSTAVPLQPLDEKSHHLVIDIQALRWDSNHWRVLTGADARASQSNEPLIVRADWLIVHVLRGELGAYFARPSKASDRSLNFHDPEIRAEDRAIARAMLAGSTSPETLELNTEIILQLARAHLAPAGLARIATELGVSRTVLEREIATSADGVKSLLLRLAYGTLPRADIEDGWLMLANLGGVAPPARTIVPAQRDTTQQSITPDTPIHLSIIGERARYSVGDSAQLTIRSDLNCRLTVISIDVSGHGTVIFPNDFATRDALNAHRDLVLPAPNAGYRFRVKERGRERVVALCTQSPGVVEGIEHDFERQRFQELGPYAAHLEAELKSELKRREEVAANAAERTSAKASAKASETSDSQHVPLHQLWRTGIVLEVD